jgi:hypothetical protein
LQAEVVVDATVGQHEPAAVTVVRERGLTTAQARGGWVDDIWRQIRREGRRRRHRDGQLQRGVRETAGAIVAQVGSSEAHNHAGLQARRVERELGPNWEVLQGLAADELAICPHEEDRRTLTGDESPQRSGHIDAPLREGQDRCDEFLFEVLLGNATTLEGEPWPRGRERSERDRATRNAGEAVDTCQPTELVHADERSGVKERGPEAAPGSREADEIARSGDGALLGARIDGFAHFR